MSKSKKKKNLLRYINKPLLFLTLLFAIGGAFLILDASSISSKLTYGNSTPYYFFIRQLAFIVVGLILAYIVLHIPTKTYKAISAIVIFALLFVIAGLIGKGLILNEGVNEVTLTILGFTFQPAEFIKLFLILYLGAFYGKWANINHKKWSFIIPLIPCVITVLFIALGGDYGSAAIMIALCALIFLKVPSTEKVIEVIKILAVFGLVLTIGILKYSYLIIPDDILESNYRLNRLIYKDACDRYEYDSGYQVCNGYIAIHNGGLFGSGIGKSVQKYLYLPASHTDFIFPIIIEELGVITGVLIIIGYMAITYFVFKIASNTYKLQNSIICFGIGVYFLLHIFVNLCGVLGLIPLTGVPLPFLSYGGSFCISMFLSFAVVQRICIENSEEKKSREIKNIVN